MATHCEGMTIKFVWNCEMLSVESVILRIGRFNALL